MSLCHKKSIIKLIDGQSTELLHTTHRVTAHNQYVAQIRVRLSHRLSKAREPKIIYIQTVHHCIGSIHYIYRRLTPQKCVKPIDYYHRMNYTAHDPRSKRFFLFFFSDFVFHFFVKSLFNEKEKREEEGGGSEGERMEDGPMARLMDGNINRNG